MKEILTIAESLGKAISESTQAQGLRTAREAITNEAELMESMQAYQMQMDKVQKLEAEGQPIEVEDKQKLQSLHDTLVASETFKAFNLAQMEYIDLMRQVNQTLRGMLAETEGAPPEQPAQ